MENPYQSPQGSRGVPFSDGGSGGLGSHIRVVAILVMVQGALELAMVALIWIVGGAFTTAIAVGAPVAPAPPGQPPPAVGWILGGFYLLWGAVVLTGAVLKLVGGWRNFHFRGRVLGLVALSSCLATSLAGCYCFPTALALFIYGLIVYLNGPSTRWFALGARGATPEEIQTTWLWGVVEVY